MPTVQFSLDPNRGHIKIYPSRVKNVVYCLYWTLNVPIYVCAHATRSNDDKDVDDDNDDDDDKTPDITESLAAPAGLVNSSDLWDVVAAVVVDDVVLLRFSSQKNTVFCRRHCRRRRSSCSTNMLPFSSLRLAFVNGS